MTDDFLIWAPKLGYRLKSENIPLKDPVIEGQSGPEQEHGTARQHDHSDPFGGEQSVLVAFLSQANPVRRTHSHNKGLTRLHQFHHFGLFYCLLVHF